MLAIPKPNVPAVEDRVCHLLRKENFWLGKFKAMSCACEVLLSGVSRERAHHALRLTANEAWRIERKYSRFRDDSVIGRINKYAGRATGVDEETARLFNCATTLFSLSDGLFDISAGILGKVWKFTPGSKPPDQAQIDQLLPAIGWDKVEWQSNTITLKPGMAIDLGGIGKEYAVDSCIALLSKNGFKNALVNLGGDIAVNGPQRNGDAWLVGIEKAVGHNANSHAEEYANSVKLELGGIATSGDQRRYIDYQDKRYSHVLNPLTGWPIEDAPKSVTTRATNASEAGMYSTLAMLNAINAEDFLLENQVQHWIQR